MATQPPQPSIEALVDILAIAYHDGRQAYDDLDRVVISLDAKLSLGKNFGSDTVPRGPLVRDVIDAFRRRSDLVRTIGAFYRALPWNEALRAWVATYQPDLAASVSETAFLAAKQQHDAWRADQLAASQANSVVAAIEAIRKVSNERLVQLEVDNSRLALDSLAGQLQTLNAYKAIHDRLHGLQTGFYQSVAGIVGRYASLSPDQAETIVLEGQKVAEAATTLDQFLEIAAFADDAPASIWRTSLTGALQAIVLAPIDVERARGGLLVVRAVLRQQLTIYDNALARVAGTLPVDKIVAFLREAGKLDNVPDEVAAAATDMSSMGATLTDRVALHKQWQLIEATLWPIEQELGPGPTPPNKYALQLLIGQLGDQLREVKNASSETWDANIDAVVVAAQDVVADDAGPIATTAPFAEMIRIIRLQFSSIDKMLLSQCAQIVKLGAPLRQLLRGGA